MGSTYMHWAALWMTIILTALISQCSASRITGIERETCAYRKGKVLQPVSVHRLRLHDLREQMLIRATIEGPEIDAYIIPSYDEHQNDEVAERDRRLQYVTGFTGSSGIAVVTATHAAIWVDDRYIRQANGELNCDWDLFLTSKNVSILDWLGSVLKPDMRVGADPHLIPFSMWRHWEKELYLKYFLNLVKVNNNLVDVIWGADRPPVEDNRIRVHETKYAGEKWKSKIAALRSTLRNMNCDAMVVTSLPEIAYILNIRGTDIPYTPVFKGYLAVEQDQLTLYTHKQKMRLDVEMHLESGYCYSNTCVSIKDYETVWRDLRTLSQRWKKILVPSRCIFDLGASEAIYASFNRSVIHEAISPIIFMKAQKNSIERAGMHTAHVKDAAAMCDVMSYIEERFALGEKLTEMKIKREVDRSRKSQDNSEGLSFSTVVAFGPHSSLPHYASSNVTNIEVTDQSTLVIDSGGQYLEGTTDVARTFHFGEPTDEMKRAYTNVLAGIIRLSTLKFPENIWPSELDAFSRSTIWDSMSDYPHATGHGIGSFSSVRESPIDISYTAKQRFNFKEGYFFSNEPGYYKNGIFGIRLENVLEVVDTGHRHPSGVRFLRFNEVTLVPYEPKLIDKSLLGVPQKRWLNEYNAKIRELVGEELKRQSNLPAFYWMMNKTRHIREYLPKEEYNQNKNIADNLKSYKLIVFLVLIFSQIFHFL